MLVRTFANLPIYLPLLLMNLSEQDIARLASFPEQNPNPVIEADFISGQITYMNSAAGRHFTDLKQKGTSHDLFSEVKKRISLKKEFKCEVQIGSQTYEQKVYFNGSDHLLRVYSHDVSEMKQIEKNLGRLASFPEQNPSPIIEVSLKGDITYFNPACLLKFPDFYELKHEHPVMQPLKKNFDKFRNGQLQSFSEEIKIGSSYYDQRSRLLTENGVIRMFNLDITEQKRSEEIIREKNKEITDSINYAKRIQESILPPAEQLEKALPDSFVLFRPKDIVSGDFYWYSPAGDYFVIAAADCTGHGVPGALMSMLGSNFLGHIVHEKNISSPGQALHELDERIRGALKQQENPDSKDGMDIALCAFQLKGNKLLYSGANRPLVMIRNKELKEYAPGKFPIGGQRSEKIFENHQLELQKGDCIYLFTDGYADQFGGPRGKKFMKKRLYELLLEIHSLPMKDQKEKLWKAFSDWKGSLEQVDDVLMIGFRA